MVTTKAKRENMTSMWIFPVAGPGKCRQPWPSQWMPTRASVFWSVPGKNMYLRAFKRLG